MGKLVYSGIGSLDGFIADAHGEFEWSAPSEEVHAFINERDRGVAAELYGRRLYEVMRVWETFGTGPDATPVETRVRRDLAEQGQGRLLDHAAVGQHRADPPRTVLRAAGGTPLRRRGRR